MLDALKPELDCATEEMRLFLRDLVRAAPTVSSAKTLAQQAGVNASALSSRFHRAGLPSPKRYLASVRLLYAAAILEDARVSLAQVAIRLRYSSPQSLGRHVREQFGLPANEFRAKYSFTALASHTAYHLLTRHRSTLRWFAPLRAVTRHTRRWNDCLVATEGRVTFIRPATPSLVFSLCQTR